MGVDGPAEQSASGADTDAAGLPPASLLPDAVRQRLVSLAADALEHLDGEGLPAALRPVLGFARQRRAKLAAAALAGALDDADFRRRVAAQVRPARAGMAAALERGEPLAADPVEVAAMTYLLRPPAWTSVLAAAVERIQLPDAPSAGAPDDQLQDRLDEARNELLRVRAVHRDQVAAVKAENADLRRRLAAERALVRHAREAGEAAAAELATRRRDAAQESTTLEAEQRRLRLRVEELTRELAGLRQSERGSRAEASTRARLLLDTLVDAAHGLRRELALPPVDVLPADAVTSDSEAGSVAPDAARALSTDDPVLLQQLVSLPRAHLLVDGYNVTKLGWPSTSLEAQRERLLRELAPLAARSGTEVTVVFDGADLQYRPPLTSPRGVRVRFSPAGVTADEVLLELVRAEPLGRPLVVVSSDGEVATGANRSGAKAVPSSTLLRLLGSRGSRTVGGGG